MGQIIAIINDKGGVAKTTTTMNLGTALWLLGKKVLLVDTDKQCNLTFTLDKTTMGSTDSTLLEWMRDRSIEAPVYERYDGFDFIPSSQNIAQLNTELLTKSGSDLYLTRRLNLLKDRYDYILIDCAPGCDSLLNANSLSAADGVIIPIRTDLYSVVGRGPLMLKIEEIRENLEKDLKVLGVLLTQFDKRTEMGRQVRKYFKDNGEMPIFDVAIRKCEDCNKAPGNQMSVFEYNAECTAAEDYMRLAMLISGEKPNPTKWKPAQWSEKANKAYDEFIKCQIEA